MIRNLSWLLLAVSVAFNVFFVVGYLQAKSTARLTATPEGIETLVKNELQLTDEQADAFHRLRAEMKKEATAFQNEMALAGRELLKELDSDEVDLERLFDMISSEAEAQRQWRLAAMRRMKEFAETLSPDQRQKLFRHVDKRRRHRIPEHVVRKFDVDGDGRLNEDEQRAAWEHVHEERKKRMARFDADGDGRLSRDEERSARRWWMMRRFDENGDGELDAEEQAAYDAHRQRRERERLERFDANGNGVLDPEEQAAAEAADRDRRRGNGRRGGHGGRGGP